MILTPIFRGNKRTIVGNDANTFCTQNHVLFKMATREFRHRDLCVQKEILAIKLDYNSMRLIQMEEEALYWITM